MKGERVERKRIAMLNKCTSWNVRQELCKMPNECGCLYEAKISIKKSSVKREWPSGCQDTASCERHGKCMYLGCEHFGKDMSLTRDDTGEQK